MVVFLSEADRRRIESCTVKYFKITGVYTHCTESSKSYKISEFCNLRFWGYVRKPWDLTWSICRSLKLGMREIHGRKIEKSCLILS